MILVVGGAYQGKTKYTMEEYGILRSEVYDCKTSAEHDFTGYKCVCNYQCEIMRNIKDNTDPVKAAEELVEDYPNIIIIMDEVGSGIIPVNKNERHWREQVGKVGCYFAERAEKVIRVVCGCAVRIK